ncbi:hypothetical protein EJB05_16207, partial [Eragrostis curvula]
TPPQHTCAATLPRLPPTSHAVTAHWALGAIRWEPASTGTSPARGGARSRGRAARLPLHGQRATRRRGEEPRTSCVRHSTSTEFIMGLDRYKPARARFTWQHRRVDQTSPRTSEKVLGDALDQRGLGGKCSFMGVCNCMQAHQRQKTHSPCPELSWQDLETKVARAQPAREYVQNGRGFARQGKGRVSTCFKVLQQEGVCYVGSQVTLKVDKFQNFDTRKADEVTNAVREYLQKGPMVGTFEVHGRDFDVYGQSEDEDEIFFASPNSSVKVWTHVVTITGFGVQGMFPFWEFQNTYGPKWRGAAHGFGLIYAVQLRWLYGFTLLL